MGSFLCEILRDRGHKVTIATRSGKAPAGFDAAVCDASEPDTLNPLKKNEFDTVIEFPGRVKNVYDVLGGYVNHIIGCGSLWMYGNPHVVPTPEQTQNECPFKGYAQRYADMQTMIADEKCLFTGIMVPNVSGPGKVPLEWRGGRDVGMHTAHKNGEKLYLPDGAEALISPTDAYDLAMLFALAAENPAKSGDQFFNVGPGKSLTMTEFVNAYSDIYGSKNEIEYVSWEKYKNEISPSIGNWWHFYTHMCPDDTKAREVLGYKESFTAEQSLERAVKWMYDEKLL